MICILYRMIAHFKFKTYSVFLNQFVKCYTKYINEWGLFGIFCTEDIHECV